MELDIKTVAPDRLEDLSDFDPSMIISLMVIQSGAVVVISLPQQFEAVHNRDSVIPLPDMEVDEYPKNIYRILGINIYEDFYCIDAIGFNDRVSKVANILKKRMVSDGIRDAFFPAFLKNDKSNQPWGATTSYFEGTEGDMPRFLRGGYARIINNENLIFAYGKELMRSKISSFRKKNWNFIPIAEFSSEITFMGRPNRLTAIIPITLASGDVYEFNLTMSSKRKVGNNIRAWIGRTNVGIVFFRSNDLVVCPHYQ